MVFLAAGYLFVVEPLACGAGSSSFSSSSTSTAGHPLTMVNFEVTTVGPEAGSETKPYFARPVKVGN